jgi:hypothetical protein
MPMFKQVSLMKRHPSLTMDEFIARYEGHHAHFGEMLFPKARRFVRRYVQPQINPLTGTAAELDFDVVMELWWDSQADHEEAMRHLATSSLLEQVRESGEALFDAKLNRAFTVVEHDSPVANPA